MSAAEKNETVTPPSERDNLVTQLYGASPLGIAAVIAGVVLAIAFLVRFNGLIGDVGDKDLRAALQALQITVVAVWIGIALWGWYLIRDGLERVRNNQRLHAQDRSLLRIEEAIAAMDKQKEVETQKSRSFWDWRRSGEQS